MKLAFYGLAAILLAGLQAYLPFSGGTAKRTRSPAVAQPTVFVDAAGLAAMHPGWQALKQMRSCLAEVRSASGGVSSHLEPSRVSWETGPDADAAPQVSRCELQDEVRRATDSALGRYESEMRQALRLRIESTRAGMMKNADLELAPHIREIKTAAAAMIRALEEKHAPDRINAQLRVAALQAAATSPAVDPGAAELKLHRANNALRAVEEACSNDKDRAIGAANAKTDALRPARSAGVDELLASSRHQESELITNSISAAHEKVMQELGSFENWPTAAVARVPEGSVRVSSTEANGDTTTDLSFARLEIAISALERQIEEDVNRAVRDLARRQGVKVTFTRGRAGVPDRTHTFARLMRRSLWAGVEPVLSAART